MEAEDNTDEIMVGTIPGLVDPVVAAPEVEGAIAEGEVPTPMKAEEEEQDVPILPLPPPLQPMQEPAPQPTAHPVHPTHHDHEAMAIAPAPGEITITDQDVLFGRGGQTNRHIGNLRYRDIISIHRQDYVNSHKTEKPNVARRIVKAIRTGKNPGRFLRRGEDGKWHEVSDKEAAWKASQALREKSRWNSMKPNDEEPGSPSAATAAVDSTVQKMVEAANMKSAEKAKKRTTVDQGGDETGDNHGALGSPKTKKVKSEKAPAQQQPESLGIPMKVSHITVPPMDTDSGDKAGAGYLLSGDVFPRDEDVLFGRGGRTNHHPGNKRLREIVLKYRETYNKAKKVDKPKVSKLIVNALRGASPPSRFLRMNEDTSRWEDVGDKRAAEKVSQLLREKDRDEKAQYLARKVAAEAGAVAADTIVFDI